MPNRILIPFCLSLALFTAGCGSRSFPPGPAASVSYEVRGEGSVTKGTTETGSFMVAKNSLELYGGRITANGKSYGSFKTGDAVLLDEQGRLFVNGAERTSE